MQQWQNSSTIANTAKCEWKRPRTVNPHHGILALACIGRCSFDMDTYIAVAYGNSKIPALAL